MRMSFAMRRPVAWTIFWRCRYRRLTYSVRSKPGLETKAIVVTGDYVIPDRRRGVSRDGTDGIPLIDMPDTLKTKAMGEQVNVADLKAAVGEVFMGINDQRLDKHSCQINFLVGMILSAYQEGNITPEVRVHVTRLSEVSTEVESRFAGSRFEHVGELCKQISGVAQSIRGNWRELNRKDVELLKPLSAPVSPVSIRTGLLDMASGTVWSLIPR